MKYEEWAIAFALYEEDLYGLILIRCVLWKQKENVAIGRLTDLSVY